jgi:hypothetical protein
MQQTDRRDFVALCVTVLTFATVGFSMWACGDEDLTFPGMVPPTATAAPTATETPDEDEDEI